MGWGVGFFGGVLVYAGFADRHHGTGTFDTADKYAVVVGAVLIVAAMLYELRNR